MSTPDPEDLASRGEDRVRSIDEPPKAGAEGRPPFALGIEVPRPADAGEIEAARSCWRIARDFDELCELGARFAEGRCAYFPGWGWPALDEESTVVAPTLARLNRAGLLTVCSQPGRLDATHALEQRAFVCGFATDAMLGRLGHFHVGPHGRGLALRVLRVDDPALDAIPVLLERGVPRIEIGHAAHSAERACFEDDVRPEVLDELMRRPFVCAWDERWGRERELWDALAATIP